MKNNTHKKGRIIASIVALSTLTLALIIGITTTTGEQKENETSFKDYNDIKDLVDAYSMGKITDSVASITSHEMFVIDNNEDVTVYDYQDEDFFVSIAPFIDQTHPCETHALGDCQGELPEEEFEIRIENDKGDIITDETIASKPNGFIDLWLPRDNTYTITLTYDDKTVTGEITTFKGDDTCITTMQLA